jgi:TPR repeat protein
VVGIGLHYSAPVQYIVGVMYEGGRGVAKDDAQAVAWYRKTAEQGNADAQYNLGLMYENGRGVAKDDAQAIVWYRKAAEQGNALAQNNLSVMYAEGLAGCAGIR